MPGAGLVDWRDALLAGCGAPYPPDPCSGAWAATGGLLRAT